MAFELLEKEMEIIAKVDLKSIVGGESVGKITGGDGSSTNPYIISASFYYGNELSSTMKSGIDNMIFGFNNAGNIQVNGSYYKFSFGGVIASSTEQAINYAGIAGADGMSTAAIRNRSLPDNVLGTAGQVTMIIDEQKNIMTGSNILSTIRHEAGHLLGFNGGFDTSGHSNYLTGLIAPETYEGQPDDFSTLEYQNMILGIISSSGSFYSEIELSSFGSTGVFSTGLNENGETIQIFFTMIFQVQCTDLIITRR